MQYDPKALPFWEIARGGGPITNIIECRKRHAADDRVDERNVIPLDMFLLLPDGCEKVSADLDNIEPVYRQQLREKFREG